MKITKSQIADFYAEGPVAIAGVSRNPKKFGYVVFETLLEKEPFEVFAINPYVDDVNGHACYKDVMSLPDHCKRLVVLVNKKQSTEIVKTAIAKGIKHIWVQQNSSTPEIIQMAQESKDVNLIYGKCIMMFTKPEGIHKFHRNMMRFFGRLPK